MQETKHQKHAKLTLRENDLFAPNEIAILGAKCSVIAELADKIAGKLQDKVKIAYLDASHKETEKKAEYDTYISHESGSLTTVQDYTSNKFTDRIRFSKYDLLFINGNHNKGAKQILILDNEKEATVKKRIDQLDRIQFVIKLNNDSKVFDFLSEKYPTIKNLKCYSIDDIESITAHVHNLVKEDIAPVQGLVLAGGKSTRMGKDKTRLEYYGKAQLDHTVELMERNLLKTFVSVGVDQTNEKQDYIQDKFVGLGAFGAICSAFQFDPNKAWLVLATDLPFVDDRVIKLLLSKRNPAKIATAVKGKSKEFMEPLIAIYEPKAYPVLLGFLSQGYSCPRKALINSDVEIIEVDDHLIRNINTPEEYQEALKEIKS